MGFSPNARTNTHCTFKPWFHSTSLIKLPVHSPYFDLYLAYTFLHFEAKCRFYPFKIRQSTITSEWLRHFELNVYVDPPLTYYNTFARQGWQLLSPYSCIGMISTFWNMLWVVQLPDPICINGAKWLPLPSICQDGIAGTLNINVDPPFKYYNTSARHEMIELCFRIDIFVTIMYLEMTSKYYKQGRIHLVVL